MNDSKIWGKINRQTKGPLKVELPPDDVYPHLFAYNGAVPVAHIAKGQPIAQVLDNHADKFTGTINARLLAASYNNFDKAGRKLGVDATKIASELDVFELLTLIQDCIPALAHNFRSLPDSDPVHIKSKDLIKRINLVAFPHLDNL